MLSILLGLVISQAGNVNLLETALAGAQDARAELRTGVIVYRWQLDRSGRSLPSDDLVGRIYHANRELDARITLYADFEQAVWKMQREDLRDVEALMDEAGIPRTERHNVSRSRDVFSGAGLAAHFLRPPIDIVLLRPAPDDIMNSVRTGVLPLRVLEALTAAAVEEEKTPGEGGSLLRVTGALPSGERVTAYLDPDLGFRYRSIRYYYLNGEEKERLTADDYRVVDGIHFPFRHERLRMAGGMLIERKTLSVQEARLNVEIPPDELNLVLTAGVRIYGVQEREHLRGMRVIQRQVTYHPRDLRTLEEDLDLKPVPRQ